MSVEKAASSQLTVSQWTLSVSTTLMQDYRQAAPLGDAQDLALAWTPEGELEVFAIGLDKNLYVLRRDPASPTGWRERRVEFPPTIQSVTSLATLDVANEHDRMFVLANGYWYEMERDEAGNDRPRFLTVFPGALRLGASDCGDDVALVAAPYVPGQKLMPCSGVLTRGIGFLLLDQINGLLAILGKKGLNADCGKKRVENQLIGRVVFDDQHTPAKLRVVFFYAIVAATIDLPAITGHCHALSPDAEPKPTAHARLALDANIPPHRFGQAAHDR